MWLEKHRIVLKIDKAPKLVGSIYEVGSLFLNRDGLQCRS
jgi:hypothetical protein